MSQKLAIIRSLFYLNLSKFGSWLRWLFRLLQLLQESLQRPGVERPHVRLVDWVHSEGSTGLDARLVLVLLVQFHRLPHCAELRISFGVRRKLRFQVGPVLVRVVDEAVFERLSLCLRVTP